MTDTGSGTTSTNGVTVAELGRRVDRMDTEMRAGFQALREDIRGMALVSPAVYAADQAGWMTRVMRIEADLRDLRTQQEDTERVQAQRQWQSRYGVIMAMIGLPLSVISAVLVALLVH